MIKISKIFKNLVVIYHFLGENFSKLNNLPGTTRLLGTLEQIHICQKMRNTHKMCADLIHLIHFFDQIFEIGSKLWLSAWASSREKNTDYNIIDEDLSTTDYISVYGIFGLFQSITFVAGIMTMNRRTLSASLHLHQSIFNRVLHSTIDFIWTTPVGQVITIVLYLMKKLTRFIRSRMSRQILWQIVESTMMIQLSELDL